MVFLRNVSNTFNQGHRGVTPLRHSATRYIIEINSEDPRRCMLIVPCQQWPAPYMRLPITVAAPINPFMSNGQKMTHILRARVRATVARAYASSSCVCLSSSGRPRNFCPRPPVRKPTFVCATTTIKAVMPAHDVFFFGSQAGLSSRLLPVLLCEEYVMTSLTANFRLICGPAGIRAGEQSVRELGKSITIPTGPQRRLSCLHMMWHCVRSPAVWIAWPMHWAQNHQPCDSDCGARPDYWLSHDQIQCLLATIQPMPQYLFFSSQAAADL